MSQRSQATQRRPLKALLLLLVLGLLVTGCSTTHRAPVVNRDPGARSAPPSATFYRVRPGDTLYAIAWQAGVDYRDLAVWNGISNPDRIHAGQLLRMWPSKARAAEAAPAKPVRPAEPRDTPPRPAATRVEPAPRPAPKVAARSDEPPTLPPPKKSPRNGPLDWRWPTQGRVVERFSANDRTRNGLKIAGKAGQDILAAEAGKIVYSGSGLIGYGQLIIIKHNKNYLSAYGHNRKILVKEGDYVARGERIAEMGKPPNDQPLLHFEIRRQGTPVDPLRLLPNRG